MKEIVYIVFYKVHKKSGFLAKLVGWHNRSDTSHVAILIDDGEQFIHYDAMFGKGVTKRKVFLSDFANDDFRVYKVKTTQRRAKRIHGMCESLLGKAYDIGGVVDFGVLGRLFATQDDEKFFCSEFVHFVTSRSGVNLLNPHMEDSYKLSPFMLELSPVLVPLFKR